MITRITRIERTSDMSTEERALMPSYIAHAEEGLAIDYPEAEITIEERPNECGACELSVDGDDEAEIEEARRDICRTLENCWDAAV